MGMVSKNPGISDRDSLERNTKMKPHILHILTYLNFLARFEGRYAKTTSVIIVGPSREEI
jgi:hypothetical protein